MSKRIHDTDFARFDRKCHLWGWGLFVFSALFFIAASWRAGDLVGMVGGVLFLVACFAFLAPFFRSPASAAAEEAQEEGAEP